MQSAAIQGKYHCCSGYCGQTSACNKPWCLEHKYHKMWIQWSAKRTDIWLYRLLWSGKASASHLLPVTTATRGLFHPWRPAIRRVAENKKSFVIWVKVQIWCILKLLHLSEVAPWIVFFSFILYMMLPFWLVDDKKRKEKKKKMNRWIWLTMHPPQVPMELFLFDSFWPSPSQWKINFWTLTKGKLLFFIKEFLTALLGF